MGTPAKSFSKEGTLKTAAILGSPPGPLDSLIFERLSGNYSVYLNADGKIKEVQPSKMLRPGAQLTAVSPRGFINDFKEMLPGDFHTVEEVTASRQGDKRQEVYALKSKDGKSIAEVHFELDLSGRLLALSVQ